MAFFSPEWLDAIFATLDGTSGFGATGSPPQPAEDVATTVLAPLFLSFGGIIGVKPLTGSAGVAVLGFAFAAGAALQQTFFHFKKSTIKNKVATY